MERKNFPLTIDELILAALKAKAQFGGDKYVLISDDEEGNGYHECYFEFSPATELADAYCSVPEDLGLEECVILG